MRQAHTMAQYHSYNLNFILFIIHYYTNANSIILTTWYYLLLYYYYYIIHIIILLYIHSFLDSLHKHCITPHAKRTRTHVARSIHIERSNTHIYKHIHT